MIYKKTCHEQLVEYKDNFKQTTWEYIELVVLILQTENLDYLKTYVRNNQPDLVRIIEDNNGNR